MHLIQHIIKRAQIENHSIAILDSREERTYSQFMRSVQQVSNGLRHGRHAKRNISILSGNRMEFAECVLGAIYAGCVCVLLDPKSATLHWLSKKESLHEGRYDRRFLLFIQS
ncbi:AMP-binding protein [Paenibacillus sp.]|uniref:AMP-binding protein n=1 Tax=Paenibacillus sp. TaxID=58172 RepID=UPI0037C526A8